MSTATSTDTIFTYAGDKAGTVVREGADYVAYNMSDMEVYRGPYFLNAAEACRGLYNPGPTAVSRETVMGDPETAVTLSFQILVF